MGSEWEMRWHLWNSQFLKKCPKFKYLGMTRKFCQKSRIIFEDSWGNSFEEIVYGFKAKNPGISYLPTPLEFS